MNKISLESGRPLAIISGGEYDNELVHLNSDISKDKKKIDMNAVASMIENLYRTMNNKLNHKQMEALRTAIMSNKRPLNRELAQFYDISMQLMDKNKDTELVLNDGEMQPVFDTTQERSVFMICGMSGSGKSTYTAKLCKVYHNQYPDNKIILFSNKPSDPVFDRLAYVDRITITEDLLTDQITLNELENSLVIFDDVECTTNKDIDKELMRISDLILQQGRSYKTSFVYITHQSNNYKATRNILNECHSVTVFPAMVTE